MTTPQYSVIIPVYNRPDEVDELLESLTHQSFKSFEVIVVEDGSTIPCADVISKYTDKLNITYLVKENTGPGTTRNFGALRASGQYLIFFDSDCIIPEHYFDNVNKALKNSPVDAFGGPDRAHPSFSSVQKAINYSMTSFFTTGGIRGGKKRMDKFYPRSFNMGIHCKAFEAVGGFAPMRFGEDVDLSLRMVSQGFTTLLIPDAYVFHKRRTDFRKFFRQVYNSGVARINLHMLHPGSLKLVHLFPTAFVIGMIALLVFSLFCYCLIFIPALYCLLVFVHALFESGSMQVAGLSILAAWVQLFGYGLGFLHAFWKRLVMKEQSFTVFEKNFYK